MIPDVIGYDMRTHLIVIMLVMLVTFSETLRWHFVFRGAEGGDPVA